MFDFVKLAVTSESCAKTLLENMLLEFTTKVNDQTGELTNRIYNARYRGLEFTIFPSHRIEIKGSLHKYWNEGFHNYNDFTITRLKCVINDLKDKFGIDPSVATVHNLEYGLNLKLPYSPNEILDNLIVYKSHPFSSMRVRGPGRGKEVYLNQYGIKIYNKGLQYKRHENIIRIEKKVITMECIYKGKVFLEMLTSPAFYQKCLQDLLQAFSKVILREEIETSFLSKPEFKTWTLAINPLAWANMTAKQRVKNKQVYLIIIQKYSTSRLKIKLDGLLKEKGLELFRPINKKGNNLTAA